jgi:crotonobetainyl-CoA:carnitine CoA-transferase CaiB-like acyl-CoA transferase
MRVRDHSDGMETSTTLLARLTALKEALMDMPRQARRLVRELARRRNRSRVEFKMPLRPGRAPGHRKKPRLDIDTVLHQCDWLARNALAPDTS